MESIHGRMNTNDKLSSIKRLIKQITAISIALLLLYIGCNSGKPYAEVKEQAFQMACNNKQVVELLGSPVEVPPQEAPGRFSYSSEGPVEYETEYYIQGPKGSGSMIVKILDENGKDKCRIQNLKVYAGGKVFVLVEK